MLRLLLFSLTIAFVTTACQPEGSTASAAVETAPAPAHLRPEEERSSGGAPKEISAKTQDPAAVSILDRVFAAHGGNRYDEARFGFTFRGKRYNFIAEAGHQIYSRSYSKDSVVVYEGIENGEFTQSINGKRQELTAKETKVGFEDLNSVIYFATLPYKLRDPAVNLYPAGTATIRGKDYDLLEVNFDEEGGGVDHDDNFMYWVNQETDRIDYLAYNYKTNKGGVRFRSAYNPRVVAGVLFQDYVNYKAPLGTALKDLPLLYEKAQLEELSRIETEDVEQLN